VTDTPETRYARSADGSPLAYQLSGEGPLDVVFCHWAPPIDLLSEDPGFVRVRRRLGTFSRTLWFDPKGMGASEGDHRGTRAGDVYDGDLIALLDAVGFARPAIVGNGASGPAAIHFAVTHPERVSALVLVNTFAHYLIEHDYPWGFSRQDLNWSATVLREMPDPAASLDVLAPSRVGDQRFRAWFARTWRFRGGPDKVGDLTRLTFEDDVRPLLSSVSVPTLVLHREGNRFIDVAAGRYLAEHIPDARIVVLPGEDHMFIVGDTDALVDEIEDFLTGSRSGAEGDVAMAAVLFTDIVASTEHQARVGAGEWSRLTDHHDAMVRAALTRHQGNEVKTTGDGFLATFDATGRALRCGADILAGAKDIGLDLRAGVHTGEVEVRGDDIAGLAVSIAKRVCDLARPGQLLVSETVRGHMVGAGIQFRDQGEHQLKGVPGAWRLFAAEA
jgi:class 3 adenylate cyclase/pimeloyl-ACP methyl ester carboxylesterase